MHKDQPVANAFICLLGVTLFATVEALAESCARQNAEGKEREEAARWEQRKQAVFETIDRGLLADHSKHSVSNATKAKIAIQLRNEATDYCNRRSEAMMQHVEAKAARFECFGS